MKVFIGIMIGMTLAWGYMMVYEVIDGGYKIKPNKINIVSGWDDVKIERVPIEGCEYLILIGDNSESIIPAIHQQEDCVHNGQQTYSTSK